MSMLKKVNIIFYIILLISALTLPALATPKVAIVLGGGAARGFSHIGLLNHWKNKVYQLIFWWVLA